MVSDAHCSDRWAARDGSMAEDVLLTLRSVSKAAVTAVGKDALVLK